MLFTGELSSQLLFDQLRCEQTHHIPVNLNHGWHVRTHIQLIANNNLTLRLNLEGFTILCLVLGRVQIKTLTFSISYLLSL